MAAIHEDDIKRIALGFLRSYYKHRPRSGEMRTETNMRGEGGIIVDSYLSYPDESGELFVTTAEATSVDTREEVKYTVQHRLLFWDSLVFGVLFGFVYSVVTYFFPGFSMPGLSPSLRAFTILFVIIGLIVLYHGLIRSMKRYRYIYAIAQFKKYHADEQWVALAKSVFPLLDENPYYRELKRQCTRFGFGLILVDNQLHPRLILSPSREEQFDRQREQIELISLPKIEGLQQLTQQNWWILKWWNKWTDPYREHDYMRFKSGFRNQLSLMGLGLVLIIVVFLEEYQRMPVYYPNESRYIENLENQTKALQEEKSTNDPKPFVIPFGDSLREEQLLGSVAPEDTPEMVPIKPQAEVMIYDPYNQTIILYDCERMYNFDDTKYIIEIGEYGDQQQALDRLQVLGDAGINGVVFWEGCFSPNRSAFVMYIENIHNNQREAQNALDTLGEKLTEVGLSAKIRPISPLIDLRY